MVDDVELLRCYAETGSEAAFAELVQRHVNLVYAAAVRRVGGDTQLAEEVAQTVFTMLARKAGSLVLHPVLIGWLHRSTHYAALDALREKLRREQRDQAFKTMNANAEKDRPLGAEIDWDEIRPVIDSLLDRLSERDRGALLLRFFDGCSFSQIGAELNVTEDAARMRVERALEKIRGLFARRGVTSTSAVLGVVLANQPALAAPVGFAAAVTSVALVGGATSGGVGALAALGALFTMSKIKIGIASAVVIAAVVPAVVEVRANRALKVEFSQLRADSPDPGRSRKESQRLNAAIGKLAANNPELDELARLRQRAAVLKARPEGVVDSQMKPASMWRNVGRETAEAAVETFHFAVFTGDRDLVASFVGFTDGSAENRAAFMAHFSDIARARYPTPERLVSAALFPGFPDKSPDDAFQVLDVRDDRRPGQVRVRWWSRAGGREMEGGDRYQKTDDGWAIAPFTISDESFRKAIVARIDPATGEPVRLQK